MFISEHLLDFLYLLKTLLLAAGHYGLARLCELLFVFLFLLQPALFLLELRFILLGLLPVLDSLILLDLRSLGSEGILARLFAQLEVQQILVNQLFDFVKQLDDCGVAHLAFSLI